MAIEQDKPKTFDKAQFLRSLNRFTFAAASSLGLLAGVTLLALRWRGLLDPNEYTYSRIAFQTFWIGLAFPTALCTMFWITGLEGSRKWFERIGFVMLFALIPAMVILALTRFIIGR